MLPCREQAPRDADAAFRTDWAKLGPALARAATAVVDAAAAGEYQGLNFYGSHDPARDADRRLHRWATTVVDTFPGVGVSIVPRQNKALAARVPRLPQRRHPVPRLRR